MFDFAGQVGLRSLIHYWGFLPQGASGWSRSLVGHRPWWSFEEAPGASEPGAADSTNLDVISSCKQRSQALSNDPALAPAPGCSKLAASLRLWWNLTQGSQIDLVWMVCWAVGDPVLREDQLRVKLTTSYQTQSQTLLVDSIAYCCLFCLEWVAWGAHADLVLLYLLCSLDIDWILDVFHIWRIFLAWWIPDSGRDAT